MEFLGGWGPILLFGGLGILITLIGLATEKKHNSKEARDGSTWAAPGDRSSMNDEPGQCSSDRDGD